MLLRRAHATPHVAAVLPRQQRQQQRLDDHQPRQNQVGRQPIRIHAFPIPAIRGFRAER